MIAEPGGASVVVSTLWETLLSSEGSQAAIRSSSCLCIQTCQAASVMRPTVKAAANSQRMNSASVTMTGEGLHSSRFGRQFHARSRSAFHETSAYCLAAVEGSSALWIPLPTMIPSEPAKTASRGSP